MTLDNVLSKIPAWIGFVILIVVGTAMFLHGALNPFDVQMSDGDRAGFIVFGLAAIAIGVFSLLVRGRSKVADRSGTAGAMVGLQSLPWWAWLVNAGICGLSVALFLALA